MKILYNVTYFWKKVKFVDEHNKQHAIETEKSKTTVVFSEKTIGKIKEILKEEWENDNLAPELQDIFVVPVREI